MINWSINQRIELISMWELSFILNENIEYHYMRIELNSNAIKFQNNKIQFKRNGVQIGVQGVEYAVGKIKL